MECENQEMGCRKQTPPPSAVSIATTARSGVDGGSSAVDWHGHIYRPGRGQQYPERAWALFAVLLLVALLLVGLVLALAHDHHRSFGGAVFTPCSNATSAQNAADVNVASVTSQSTHWVHGPPQTLVASWLTQLTNASELHVDAASNATRLRGVLFPRNGTLGSFDAAVVIDAAVETPNRQYVVLANGKGYQWLAMLGELDERVVFRGCLEKKHLPPLHELASVARTAAWVTLDKPVDERVVRVTFSGETYDVWKQQNPQDEEADCWLMDGESTQARVCIAELEEDFEPNITESFQSIAECPELAALSNMLQPELPLDQPPLPLREWFGSYNAPVRRAQALSVDVSVAVKSVLDGWLTSASGSASASEASDSVDFGDAAHNCTNGLKKCLFVHGIGVQDDVGVEDSFDAYWGSRVAHALPCCSETKFVHLNTVREQWYSPRLSQKLCEAASAVAANRSFHLIGIGNTSRETITAPNKTVVDHKKGEKLQDLAVIAHSSGNLNVAAAMLHGDCSLDANSSVWLALQGPMLGTRTANQVVAECSNRTLWDDLVRSIMGDLDLCPISNGTNALVFRDSNDSGMCLDTLYDKAAEVFRLHVNASLCGVDPVGIPSLSSATYSTLATFSNHSSEANDGVVDFTSCRGGLPANKYRATYCSAFYRAELNHDDGRFINGDTLWGQTRQPLRWLQLHI